MSVTLQTALLALIINHLQMHPSLNLPIRTIFQCIFIKNKIIVDFSKELFFLFLNILHIQTYKFQNVPISAIFWHQFLAILCNFKHATKKKIKLSFKWSRCNMTMLLLGRATCSYEERERWNIGVCWWRRLEENFQNSIIKQQLSTQIFVTKRG